MMDEIRSGLAKRPWIGWVVALVVLALSAVTIFLQNRSDSPYSPESMTEMLTIRYTDTDEVERIPRGRLDKLLRGRTSFDPAEGIVNPKTGKPTGFLVDEEEWTAMLARIKAEKERFKAGGSALQPSQPAAAPKGGK